MNAVLYYAGCDWGKARRYESGYFRYYRYLSTVAYGNMRSKDKDYIYNYSRAYRYNLGRLIYLRYYYV